MPRGSKNCKGCQKVCGPRTLVCSCGFDFFAAENQPKTTDKQGKKGPTSQKRRVSREPRLSKVNWRELENGDTIKVLGKGGPKFMGSNGAIPMGYKGKFIVRGIQDEGILAYSGKEGGWCFIHMGPKRMVNEVLMRPHKIVRVSKREKVA